MKKAILLILLISFVSNTFSQITPYDKPSTYVYQSTYEPLDMRLLMEIVEKKNAAYEKNSDYLDRLLNLILDVKSKTTESQLHSELDLQYRKLMKLADTDLSIAKNDLRDIEFSIKSSVEKYVNREKEKNNPLNYYQAGFSALENGNVNGAISNFSKVIELTSDYEPAFTMRAQCYYDIGYFKEAISDLNKSVLLSPENYYPFFLRGWCFNYLNQGIEALQDFNKVVELIPEKELGYFGRGYAKSHLSDFYGSNKDYLKTIEINPNHSMAYNNIGWNYFEKGEFNKALEYVNKALEVDTNNSTAWDSRAEINFNLGNYSQCIIDCDRALAINSKIANCFFIKGRAYYRLGQKEKACIEWSSAGENGKYEAYEYIDKYCK